MSSSLTPSLMNKSLYLFNEHSKDPKFKTEICKNWEKSGSCPYNTKCRFAHGKIELMAKEMEANPNYKGKDCLSFFKYGYCNYGRRCCFKHDERKFNELEAHRDFSILLKVFNPIENKRLSIFLETTKTDYCFDKRNSNISSSTASSSSNSYSKNSIYNKQKKFMNSMINEIENIYELKKNSLTF